MDIMVSNKVTGEKERQAWTGITQERFTSVLSQTRIPGEEMTGS